MHHILLSIAGMSPAVVTETIWALAVDQGVELSEVRILTTQASAGIIKEPIEKACKSMAADYPKVKCLKGIKLDIRSIRLDDIRDMKDNEKVSNWIMAQTREACLDHDTTVHASLAGGRKTMGYFLGTSMQFFGRAQDRLYHVLVDEQSEGCREFFYPAPKGKKHLLEGRSGKQLDASKSQVELAEIPFISLRGFIPDINNVASKLGFKALTDRARADLNGEFLDVHVILPGTTSEKSIVRFGDPGDKNAPCYQSSLSTNVDFFVYTYVLYLAKQGGRLPAHKMEQIEGIADNALKWVRFLVSNGSGDEKESTIGEVLQRIQRDIKGSKNLRAKEEAQSESADLFYEQIKFYPSRIGKAVEMAFRKNPITNPVKYRVVSRSGEIYVTIPPEKIYFWRLDRRGKLQRLEV